MAKIRIRPLVAADAAAFHAAALESTAELLPWMPWCHARFTLEEAAAWTGAREALFAAGDEYSFAIVDADGRFLGACDLNQINRAYRVANVGYWVRSSATAQGVAAEAIRQLARYAFAETDLERLEIVCAAGNVRSQRAAEKAGAVREGVLRSRLRLHDRQHDAVVYAIVRAAWSAG
jgi:RimJ/RimL family protein N-acetyltransferase